MSAEYVHDKYDDAYERGYGDGMAGLDGLAPNDDTEINYIDGHNDGRIKRECDELDAAEAAA